MGKRNPLEKRIRRQVGAREHTFFAATSPGLKKLCEGELKALFPESRSIRPEEGGVSFEGKVSDCYAANLHLRTANRILMRIGAFKATRFDELASKISDFPWELYLSRTPELSVSAKHSKLYHTDAVGERFAREIEKKLGATPHLDREKPESHPQTLFVRALDDRFTLSLDSSGELLHKRGIQKSGAAAPMRETLAAAALKLAGYVPGEPLVDPMCGSGTFSVEASMMQMNIPAGWFRKFAFMGWPVFSSGTWKHLRREAEKGFQFPDTPAIFASDRNGELCRSLTRRIMKYGLEGAVRVTHRDFFSFSPGVFGTDLSPDAAGLVVINPPYGLRLGSREDAEKLFGKISDHLRKEYRGWKFALVAPGKSFVRKVPFKSKASPFSHGGLKMTLLTGIVDS